MVRRTRNVNKTNAKKRGILRLLSAPGRYIKRKVKSFHRKLVKKEPNTLDSDVNNVEKLKRKSINESKEIAKLRIIKNSDKLKKEGLITSLLKSESSSTERNYMKHFNNNANDDNNTNDDNNDNNTNDNTYDDKIRDKKSDIRMTLSRLENTVTNNDRKKIKKSFMK